MRKLLILLLLGLAQGALGESWLVDVLVSRDWQVSVFQNSQDCESRVSESVPVYPVKVDHVVNGNHHPEEAAMAPFTLYDSAAVVRIVSATPVESVRVRPASAKVKPIVDGDTIRLEVSRTGTLSVEINGDIYHNLHLIANPKYNQPEGRLRTVKDATWKASKDGKRVVFPAGFHRLPEEGFMAVSGQEIYIADGAWVEGGIKVCGVEDVHVYGPGIVRPSGRGYGVEIKESHNVVVEGITTTQVPCGGSDHVTIRNVKCFTHYGWGDGLNIFASSHVTQEGCFVRTSDDCITVYATRMGYVGNAQHIRIKDMTLWADVAHPVFMGLHGAAAYISDNTTRGLRLADDADDIIHRSDTISDVIVSNIDILEHNEMQVDYQGCMAIVCGDNNVVHDITFDEVRVDSIRRGALLALRVFQNKKYCKAPGKSISDVTFRNVSAVGSGELSIIEGYDVERTVSGITFENLTIDGVHICDDMPGKPGWYKTTDMCRMLMGSFVDNLSFK